MAPQDQQGIEQIDVRSHPTGLRKKVGSATDAAFQNGAWPSRRLCRVNYHFIEISMPRGEHRARVVSKQSAQSPPAQNPARSRKQAIWLKVKSKLVT